MDLGRDVRFGVRMLRKQAVVTLAAVASLSLALGACLAAFALADALILRPLPVRDPHRLVYLTFATGDPERPASETFSDPMFLALRDAGRERVDLFAVSTQVVRAVVVDGGDGSKEQWRTQYVSGDAFERLGIGAAVGRVIGSADDVRDGAQPVAVLSHAFWTRRFGGDASAIGRWITMDDRPFRIAGVARKGFTGVEPGRPTDVWFPYSTYNPRAFGNASSSWFRVFGRLRAETRAESAAAILQPAFRAFRREYAARSSRIRSPEEIETFVNVPLFVRAAANGPSPLRRQFERPAWLLASIALLVLAIAGSNLANLFLARGAAREREMALRLSIGASRGRLVRQMLVESTIVAGAACLLGLLFAFAAAPAVVRMIATPGDPLHLDLAVNWRVAGAAVLLTVALTAMFGLAPALRASGVTPARMLQSGDARGGGRARAMRPFVALQAGFGVAVLFVGGLLVLSFARLSRVDPGFATDVLQISVEPAQRMEPARQRAAQIAVLERLRMLPGVEAASAAEFNPLGRAWTHNLLLPGGERRFVEATVQPVTPGYFEAMRIPLRAGRTFDRRELAADSTSLVVNEAFARAYFRDTPPLGGQVPTRFFDSDTGPYHVVGIVADAKYDVRRAAAPIVYVHLSQRPNLTLQVRASGDRAGLPARIREAARAASPELRVTTIETQAESVARTLVRERLLAWLSGFFAIVGLTLAAMGLYGVLSYSVIQRTREIGIRSALGARPLDAVRAILADAAVAVSIGSAAGFALGFYLSRFLGSLLFEVRPLEFWSLALPCGVLIATGVVAAALPAIRAARLDPAAALRHD